MIGEEVLITAGDYNGRAGMVLARQGRSVRVQLHAAEHANTRPANPWPFPRAGTVVCVNKSSMQRVHDPVAQAQEAML